MCFPRQIIYNFATSMLLYPRAIICNNCKAVIRIMYLHISQRYGIWSIYEYDFYIYRFGLKVIFHGMAALRGISHFIEPSFLVSFSVFFLVNLACVALKSMKIHEAMCRLRRTFGS